MQETGNKIHLYTDKSFDLDKAKQYSLSIQVSLDGFSFLITDLSVNKVAAFKHNSFKISSENFLAARINEWIESEPFLKASYQQVHIIYPGKKFTFVPQDKYQPELKYNYIDLLYGRRVNEIIVENKLESHNLILLYSIPGNLKEELDKQYSHAFYFHPLRHFACNLPELDEESRSGLVLYFEQKNFFLLLYNKKQIIFANNFSFQHKNDIIYYVLTALRQMKASADTTEVSLSGNILNADNVKTLLSQYFKKIKYLSPISSVNYSSDWFNNQDQQFVALFHK